MNQWLSVALAWLAGCALGAAFFGSLWWTIRQGLTSKRPALWFLIGLLARMSIALVGFLLVSDGHWQRLVACLIGFLTARVAVTWLCRTDWSLPRPAGEATHAALL